MAVAVAAAVAVVAIVVVVVVVVVVGVPPRCDAQTSYFWAFLWSEMLVFTALLFRSFRKWQLFLVSCVFFCTFSKIVHQSRTQKCWYLQHLSF